MNENMNLLNPDVAMLIFTWVTFFLLLVILQKVGWKPIVDALEKREKEIREALVSADKAKAQLANLEEEKHKILELSKAQAVSIIDQARKTARNVAADIEAKGRQNALDIIQGAHEQIEIEKQKLLKSLRQESAEMAITLASKIIKENMDKDKNHRLIEEAIKQL